MFTRRHYETIAATLKASMAYSVYRREGAARTQHALLCNDFANRFKAGNELFDRTRFLLACGLDAETVDSL